MTTLVNFVENFDINTSWSWSFVWQGRHVPSLSHKSTKTMTSVHKCHHHNYAKNFVFWAVVRWSRVINYRPFGGACCFHFKVVFCDFAANGITFYKAVTSIINTVTTSNHKIILNMVQIWRVKKTIYVSREIEARSCNQCCRGKTISITYSECVFVALVMQHAKRTCHVILSSLASHIS